MGQAEINDILCAADINVDHLLIESGVNGHYACDMKNHSLGIAVNSEESFERCHIAKVTLAYLRFLGNELYRRVIRENERSHLIAPVYELTAYRSA